MTFARDMYEIDDDDESISELYHDYSGDKRCHVKKQTTMCVSTVQRSYADYERLDAI